MPLVAIVHDSKGRGTCRSCKAPITWARTIRGKAIPFDGDIVVVRTEGSPLTGSVVEYVDTDVTPTHFQTCPQASDWRKRSS